MKLRSLSLLLFIVGFIILLHQALVYGKWFETRDFLHHENVAAVLFAFAAGTLLADFLHHQRP